MIRQATSDVMKIVMSLLQCGHEIVESLHCASRLFESFEPFVKGDGLMNLQGFVGSIGGIDAGFEIALTDQLMVFQRVGRIVLRAQDMDVMVGKEIMNAQPG